jgi:DNA polymerase I-like protein with 3'-5' exonuclease and polymerase domains
VFDTDYAGGKQIRDNFFSIYRNLLRASNYAQNHALHEGRVRLWSGRYRNFLNRKEEAHKAYNSFIQGTAADLVERAMIRSAQFESADAWMMLQIHDSVVWSIRKDLLSILVPLIQFEMSNCGPEWSVPFKTDAHYWGGEKVNVSTAA